VRGISPACVSVIAQPGLAGHDRAVAFLRVDDLDLVVGRPIAVRGSDRVAAHEWTDGDPMRRMHDLAAQGSQFKLRSSS